MSILDKLATALNRRDELPNKELAQEIVCANDTGAVRELVEQLSTGTRNIQSDCIKVLDEIGKLDPGLIAGYYREIGELLDSSNNRLVWGAMAVLDTIALQQPKGVYGLLDRIIQAAETGSVITRDHAVGILTKLATLKRYTNDCIPPLLKQLATCPDNQFPTYAEKSLEVMTTEHRETFRNILRERLDALSGESKHKRVSKVLKRIES